MRECVVFIRLYPKYYLFEIWLKSSLACGSMASAWGWLVQVLDLTVSKAGQNIVMLKLVVLFRDKCFIWILFLMYFAAYVPVEARIISDISCCILVYILMLHGWNSIVKMVAHRARLLYILLPLLDVALFMFVGNQ